MLKRIGLILLGLLVKSMILVHAFVISGKVVSANDAAVPFASVYLSGTTCGTSTNSNGEFSFAVSVAGKYELVVSHLNFELNSQPIDVSGDIKGLVVRLQEKSKELQIVVVKKRDPHRKENLELFISKLLGNTPNRKQCTILNPRCLYFYRDTANRFLKAFADSVLIIRNESLGYQMKYQLIDFYTTRSQTMFKGYILFEDISLSVKNNKEVEERRKEAYYGSLMHFFRSLYTNTLMEDGFRVFKTVEKTNEEQTGQIVYFTKSMVKESYGVMKSPMFVKDPNMHIEQTLDYLDLYLYTSFIPNSRMKVLQYDNPFEVDYVKAREAGRYQNDPANYYGLTSKRRTQVSLLKVSNPSQNGVMVFDESGNSKIYGEVSLAGYMGWKKVMAEWLPLDFVPTGK